MAPIDGQRQAAGTKTVLEASKEEDFSNIIFNPEFADDESSLNALLHGLNKKKVTDNPRFDVLDDGMRIDEGATSGTVDTTTTTIPCASNFEDECEAGTVLYLPRTGERMLVASIGAADVVVTRNHNAGMGGTEGTGAAILSGDTLRIVGTRYAEGSTASTARTTTKENSYNYTEITKTSLEMSRTVQKTKMRAGGPLEDYYLKLKMFEHRKTRNHKLWWGARGIVTSGAQAIRETGGVFQHLTGGGANSVAITNGVMTMKIFDQIAEQLWDGGGSSVRHGFCGLNFLSALDGITRGFVRVVDNKESFGMRMMEVVTNKGVMRFIPEKNIFRGDGNTTVVFLDMDQLTLRYLRDSDTKLTRNIEVPGTDGLKHEYLVEEGLEMRGYGIGSTIASAANARSPHGYLTGFTTY